LAGKLAATNKNGKRFVLYLMPTPQLFTYDQSGLNKYSAICSNAGLKMVISGFSSYSDNCAGGKCIPLPGKDNKNDENDQHWGSSSDVDDYIHQVTGWDDFVIHHYGDNKPYNYPSGSSGWATPKRAVCGIEL
jgi:hypothetical protein